MTRSRNLNKEKKFLAENFLRVCFLMILAKKSHSLRWLAGSCIVFYEKSFIVGSWRGFI